VPSESDESSASRFRCVQSLFLQAARLFGPERDAFLDSSCGGDDALRADVLALLKEDAQGGTLLDGGLAEAACGLLNDSPSPGRRVGPYRLLRVLGEGGMGVVYLAERPDLGNFVAIKLLRDAWLSPARRERFASEQRLLARLNHPSVARLYDANVLPDGTPWFVMEYVEGEPITAYCVARACSVAERLRLFRSVCEAVQYAHRQAIIHRDLKPSNILVKPDGGVRLLDFGISKQLDSLDQATEQTRTELRLMTPAYAAPEQLRGEPVGVFTDVYALGVILYELLAGQLPARAGDDPEKPSSLPRSMETSKASWADLDVICLTAMRDGPERRYRSVEALIRDIDHFLAGEPLEARADTRRYRMGKFLRRNRVPAAGAALASVVIAALIVFFTWRLANARNDAIAAVTRMQRVRQFMLDLFDGGDPSAAPPGDLRALALIERGVKEASTLQAEPEVQADLFLTLGAIDQKLGNLAQADTLLNSALAERKALFGPAHPQVAESLVALGLLRIDQARFPEAEDLIRRGLDTFRHAPRRDNQAIAKASAALGKILEAKGSYAQAIPVLEGAVQLASSSDSPSLDVSAMLKELADAQFYAGHYGDCERLTMRTLSMHRQALGEHHPLVAEDLINLGAVQFERGQYPQAERRYREALAINESWYGPDHPATASTLSMLGRALVFEHRYDEAVALVERALAIQEKVYGSSHPRVANVLNELGTVALQRGHLEEAEVRFRRMLEIYKAAYGERHYRYSLALANLASVYLARKEYVRAEPLFRAAIRHYREALSPDHLYVGIAEIKLGRALNGQKRYAEAEAHELNGYRILASQTSPSVTWLQSARKDLVTIYEALHQPDKAAHYRAELAGIPSAN
jgi:serine/threonine-protein kinase